MDLKILLKLEVTMPWQITFMFTSLGCKFEKELTRMGLFILTDLKTIRLEANGSKFSSSNERFRVITANCKKRPKTNNHRYNNTLRGMEICKLTKFILWHVNLDGFS